MTDQNLPADTQPPEEQPPTLADLEERILAALKAMRENILTALMNGKETGELLNQAEPICKKEKRNFAKWVKNHFGLEERTARNYRNLAKNWHTIQTHLDQTGMAVQDLSERQTLALIRQRREDVKEDQEPETPEPQKKPKLTPDQQEAMQWLLIKHGMNCSPGGFLAALFDLGVRKFEPLLKGLGEIREKMTEQKFSDWINAFDNFHEAWDDACDLYGVDPAVMAWVAEKLDLGVTQKKQKDSWNWKSGLWAFVSISGGRTYKQVDEKDYALIAGNGAKGIYYLVPKASWNHRDMARKAAEWLADEGDELPLEVLPPSMTGKAVMEQVRQKLAALHDDRKHVSATEEALGEAQPPEASSAEIRPVETPQEPTDQAQPPLEASSVPPAEGQPEQPAEPDHSGESPRSRSRRRR